MYPRVSLLPPLRRSASWKIPVNTTVQHDRDLRIIRLRPSELNHPFYNIGPMEQFLLCFRYHGASLLHGKAAFPVYDRHADLHVPTALRFASSSDLPEWVSHYSFHVHNNVFRASQQLRPLTSADIAKLSTPTFITPETSASIGSIALLLERNAQALRPLPPLKLTSLVDAVVLTTEGVFTEDLYTYILQTQPMTRANVGLVLAAMLHHMQEGKLDQFGVVDKLVSQTVTAMLASLENVPSAEARAFAADFEEFLAAVKVRFPGNTFSNTTTLQLLALNLRTDNIAKSRDCLRSLMYVHNCVPEVHYIEAYLALLQKWFPDDRTTKLAYISPLTYCLDHQMVPALIRFCIPLCIDIIELQSLLKMTLKNAKGARVLDRRILAAFLDQVQAVADDDVMAGIYINGVYSKIDESGMDVTPYADLFVNAYAQCQNFAMIAQLLETRSFKLDNAESVETLVQAIKKNESSEIPLLARKGEMFLAQYIAPVCEQVGLSQGSVEYIRSKQVN